jgi:hypothetical protein
MILQNCLARAEQLGLCREFTMNVLFLQEDCSDSLLYPVSPGLAVKCSPLLFHPREVFRTRGCAGVRKIGVISRDKSMKILNLTITVALAGVLVFAAGRFLGRL